MSNMEELTPESLIEEGKKWEKFVLANASIEERLKDLSPQERLKDLSPQEMLKHLSPQALKEVQEYLDTLKNKQK